MMMWSKEGKLHCFTYFQCFCRCLRWFWLRAVTRFIVFLFFFHGFSTWLHIFHYHLLPCDHPFVNQEPNHRVTTNLLLSFNRIMQNELKLNQFFFLFFFFVKLQKIISCRSTQLNPAHPSIPFLCSLPRTRSPLNRFSSCVQRNGRGLQRCLLGRRWFWSLFWTPLSCRPATFSTTAAAPSSRTLGIPSFPWQYHVVSFSWGRQCAAATAGFWTATSGIPRFVVLPPLAGSTRFPGFQGWCHLSAESQIGYYVWKQRRAAAAALPGATTWADCG